MPYKELAKEKARHRNHMRRVTVSDVTHGQESAMRKRARKCPLCDVRMTDKPHLPNSKELDHILPVNQGGTHTHGNVRIICRKCNQSRPKDGSDYTGMLTLWAQGPAPIARADARRPVAGGVCRKGLHPWIPSNVKVRSDGRETCASCYEARRQRRLNPPRQCGCGALFQASGNQFMCPACIDAAAHKAAELHAGGMSWPEVACEIGYGSHNGEGARYAAKRIGYIPGPAVRTRGKDPAPKLSLAKLLPCRRCGSPVPDARGQRRPACKPCLDDLAWQAVELYNSGIALRPIADLLGYRSITTVSNLMKSVTEIDMRVGRPAS